MTIAEEIVEAVEAIPIRGEVGDTFKSAWDRRLKYAEDAIQIILTREAKSQDGKIDECLELVERLHRAYFKSTGYFVENYDTLKSMLEAMKGIK